MGTYIDEIPERSRKLREKNLVEKKIGKGMRKLCWRGGGGGGGCMDPIKLPF